MALSEKVATMRTICGLTILATLAVQSNAWAQRNFSNSQRAGLQAYITQLQSQQRVQQQNQLRQINQQFDRQQADLQSDRMRLSRLAEGVDDLNSDAAGRSYRRIRGNNSFGDMHYANSLFQRTAPYYDYRFVTARNRNISNIGGGATAPR